MRLTAAQVLLRVRGEPAKAATAVLVETLKDARPENQLHAAQILWQTSAPEKTKVLPVLLELLKNPPITVRLADCPNLGAGGPR